MLIEAQSRGIAIPGSMRLMGFGDDFRIPVSDTRAYKQFGNSVVVPVIAEVARIMVPHLEEKNVARRRSRKAA